METCTTCEGTGYIELLDRDQDGWYTYRKPCPTCRPSGATKLVHFDWTILTDPDPSERIFTSREDI